MGKITFRDIIELLFLPVLTAGVFVLWDLNKNVNDLNVRVGVIIATSGINEKEMSDLKTTMKEQAVQIKDLQLQVQILKQKGQ